MEKAEKIERVQKSIKFITGSVQTWCDGTYITEKIPKNRACAVFAIEMVDINDSAKAKEIATNLAAKLVNELK